MSSRDGQPARPGDALASGSWGYRPHLDGLRAVAVLVVVAFHSGADRFSGGFIGVDVFFVLSGYLVTQVLLGDLREGGTIGYRRFYARRFRRLLPAAVVVLAVTALVFPEIAAPVELADAEGAIRAAALYASNWFFIGQAENYFAGNVQASPVVHFWSLSVEEQFYLGWPLLLGGLYRAARRVGERAWTVVRVVVAAAALVSLGRALMLADTALNRAYFGTDTRVYQLFAGALVALSPGVVLRLAGRRRARPLLVVGSVGATIGLLVLCTSAVELDAVERGAAAAAATVALIVCLEAAGGPVRFVLSRSPLVYLGRISYGIYLWHWLIILVIVDRFELSPLAVGAAAAVLASGLAALSYQLLELPVRESGWLDRRRVGVLVGGVAMSALVGLVVAPVLLDRDDSRGPTMVAGPALGTGGTPIPADLDWEAALADRGSSPRAMPASRPGAPSWPAAVPMSW